MEQQKTINKSFALEGKGLQTGKPVKVFFYPAKENEGISFVRTDLKNKPSVHLAPLDTRISPGGCLTGRGNLTRLDVDRRSKIGSDKTYVETVEHLMAALWGAEIDNIRIEMDSSEAPALDGSAIEFLEAIKKARIKKESEERKFIEIKEPVWAEEKDSFLGIFPSNVFKVSCILEYPNCPIGRQFFSEVLTPDIFEREIAPARTIWFVPEGPGSIGYKARIAKSLGYGRGANEENVLVISKDGAVNKSRFPDEPVRHKVLDLIGDLYLLGKPLKGRVIAIRSGHKLNLELVKKIREKL